MIDQKEGVLIKVSIAVTKTKNDLNHFGKERINFIKELVWSIIQRSCDKNSRRDPGDRNRRKDKCCLLTYTSCFAIRFVIAPRMISPGMVPLKLGWARLYK